MLLYNLHVVLYVMISMLQVFGRSPNYHHLRQTAKTWSKQTGMMIMYSYHYVIKCIIKEIDILRSKKKIFLLHCISHLKTSDCQQVVRRKVYPGIVPLSVLGWLRTRIPEHVHIQSLWRQFPHMTNIEKYKRQNTTLLPILRSEPSLRDWMFSSVRLSVDLIYYDPEGGDTQDLVYAALP